jgi:hypothetical protein
MKLSEQLTLLVDELLDAHEDTVRLSADLELGWRWQAHLCYLRELTRLGRESLAAGTADGPWPPLPSARTAPARMRPHHEAGKFRSNLQRRGARRCARNGSGEGPT